MKYLVIFSHGENGWGGTSRTAAKSTEAASPTAAIAEVKKLAADYYSNPRDFKAWVKA
jgi:hypothetical protein